MGGPYVEGQVFCDLCGGEILAGDTVVRVEDELLLENEKLQEGPDYVVDLFHASCYGIVDPIDELRRIKDIINDAFGAFVENMQLNSVDYDRELNRIAWGILRGKRSTSS